MSDVAAHLAREIVLFLIGLVVLLPLIYWQGRERWVRGLDEDKVMFVGFIAFVLAVAIVAIYKQGFAG
jgi:hypothetical protein